MSRNIQEMDYISCASCGWRKEGKKPDEYPCNDCWWKTLNNWKRIKKEEDKK